MLRILNSIYGNIYFVHDGYIEKINTYLTNYILMY
jgi:hypothetical protein